VNVKEVTTLLKAKGIDLDNNRFLILQVTPVLAVTLLPQLFGAAAAGVFYSYTY